jgi:hypothetical protein
VRGHEQNGLILFKRHQNCRSADCISRIPPANRKFWFECDCLFWIVGKLALERRARASAEHLESQGVFDIRQMTVDHLETFKTAGLPTEMASTSRATTDAKIRCFLRAAFRRSWIKEALALKVSTVKAVYEQKEPYTGEPFAFIVRLYANGLQENSTATLFSPARRPAEIHSIGSALSTDAVAAMTISSHERTNFSAFPLRSTTSERVSCPFSR